MNKKIYLSLFALFFLGCEETTKITQSKENKSNTAKQAISQENIVSTPKEEELKGKLREFLDKQSENLKNTNHHNLDNVGAKIHNERFLQMQNIIFNIKLPNTASHIDKALQHQQKQMEKLNHKNTQIMQ